MTTPLRAQLIRRKPIDNTDDSGGLARSITTFQLTMIGVGSTIGTGIFFVMALAVPEAGPSVIISFIVAGIAAGLAVICYAEMASSVPVSGSTYSYAYATLGEGVAMGVAACLLLEYAVSAAAVAVGWSSYLNELLRNVIHAKIPAVLSSGPFDGHGGSINLPAVILVAICAALLIRGAGESARVNATMVLIKLAVLVVFVVIAATAFNSNHFSDFLPLGVHGVSVAAGTIFFSFIGMDALSTAGNEAKNPQKALPRALVAALFTVITTYVLVAFFAVGAQPWQMFAGQTDAGLSQILQNITHSSWAPTFLAAGAVISIFSVTLVTIYGQSRVLFAMSRDGMLPQWFSTVNTTTRTPIRNTVATSLVVALLAAFVPLDKLADMVSIGTLTAFIVVSLGVIILRRTAPDLPRGFTVPGYPVTPVLAIAACIYVLSGLHWYTWAWFGVWVFVVLAYYVLWARKHSKLQA